LLNKARRFKCTGASRASLKAVIELCANKATTASLVPLAGVQGDHRGTTKALGTAGPVTANEMRQMLGKPK
jgi:hypothetical protein